MNSIHHSVHWLFSIKELLALKNFSSTKADLQFIDVCRTSVLWSRYRRYCLLVPFAASSVPSKAILGICPWPKLCIKIKTNFIWRTSLFHYFNFEEFQGSHSKDLEHIIWTSNEARSSGRSLQLNNLDYNPNFEFQEHPLSAMVIRVAWYVVWYVAWYDLILRSIRRKQRVNKRK